MNTYKRIEKYNEDYTKIIIYKLVTRYDSYMGEYDDREIITTYWVRNNNLDRFNSDYEFIKSTQNKIITEGDTYC